MHARALRPPAGATPRWAPPAREHPALGWQVLLEDAAHEEPTECGPQLAKCVRCRTDKECAQATRRAGERALVARPGLHHI
eukprot:8107644-Lingulodinium_polyedra.AAC.1